MKRVISAVCAILLAGSFAGISIAQDLTAQEEFDARQKIQTAVSLAEIAEAEGDGEAMLVAARLLSSVGKVAKMSQAEGEDRSFYSVSEIAQTAKTMGADAALADEVGASASTEREICYWEFKCGTFDCGWIYVCE